MTGQPPPEPEDITPGQRADEAAEIAERVDPAHWHGVAYALAVLRGEVPDP